MEPSNNLQAQPFMIGMSMLGGGPVKQPEAPEVVAETEAAETDEAS
jgi:hypothetical protein